VIGLGAALDYVRHLGLSAIHEHKQVLLQALEKVLREIPGVHIFGEGPQKTALCSFALQGIHSSDVGQILDEQGIAVRTGHLCAQPLADRMKVAGFVRASLSIYNTLEEVEAFGHGLKKVEELLR
jgi:cysteine desulfurase/selenocysteine lyase